MYIGNVVLLILNLPLVPLFAQILRLPVFICFRLSSAFRSLVPRASGPDIDLGLRIKQHHIAIYMLATKPRIRRANPASSADLV